MYKKISLGWVVLLITTLLLTACQEAATPKALDCASSEVLCVGLVTGLEGVNDQSFNQMAWEGVLEAQTEKVADKVQYIETIDAKDYAMNVTTFADEGFDIIVTVGDRYREATTATAKSYPGTYFIGVDQDQGESLPNQVGLVFREDQAGFQAGSLAAMLSKTNTIAAVLGPDTEPEVVALKEGYEAGAKYINPDIKIISAYYPDGSVTASSDPRWAASAASQAIQEGADIILDAGDMTGNGALVEVASHPGLYCIGVETDLWETIPEARPCLLSSAMKFITSGVFDLIKQAKDGSFTSGKFLGDSGLAPYHDFDTAIQQAIKDEISQISAGLIDGSITTGYDSDQ